LRLTSVEKMEALEEHIATLKPALVIIDPLYSAAPLENFMTEAAEKMIPLKKMRDKYGTTFLMVHHQNKGEGVVTGPAALARSRAWGTVFLDAATETSWVTAVDAIDKTLVYLQRGTKMGKPQPVAQLNFDISTDRPYKYAVTVTEGERSFNSEERMERWGKPQDPNDLLAYISGKGGASITDICEAMGTSRSTISAELAELVNGGSLTCDRDGFYRIVV
jgi:hypothetical protein